MRKSLFRIADILELCIGYIFCFSLNVFMDYAKTLDLDSYILKSFLKNYIDYQHLIVLLFTFIVLVFHYQMLHRKNTEIFCRILVGDTAFHIKICYMLDCIAILVFACFLSTLETVCLNVNLTGNFYLAIIFIIYILISARQVRGKI